MAEYCPNFKDPRVIARCRTALGFVCGAMSESKPHEWSTRYIDQYLGSQRNDLSKYLRETLLICTDEYFRFNDPNAARGVCKKYVLNKQGVEFLREKLNISHTAIYPIVVEVAKTLHTSELSSGIFTYTEKSNRLWHPLQRYRKEIKQQLLSENGMPYQYDIQCSAPTLIHQYSQQIPIVLNHKGKWIQGPMDLHLDALTKYLRDRSAIRKRIAQEIDVPVSVIKEIINAMFAGAIISRSKKTDIYHMLDGDLAKIEWLKQDAFVQELKEDIKICWEHINPTLQKRTKITKKGTERRLAINSKQKWSLYFELERQVLNSVRRYLDSKSFKYFLEHDGWSCNNELDISDLRDHVKQETGFNLMFEYNKIEINNISNNIPYCSGSPVAHSNENALELVL